MARTQSYWGWGYEDAALGDEQRGRLRLLLSTQLDASALTELCPRDIATVELPPSRIAAEGALAPLCSAAPRDRASHTYGKAYRDVVRGLAGDFAAAPDLVAFPRSEADVVALLDWCASRGYALVPYGGGSSVVGGVEARCRAEYPGVVSLDLGGLCGVVEIDATSRAACIEGGTMGPAIEEALKPHGLTLRHYPQSFEHSSLGGWLATRAGGHFATLYTHIDDLVESTRVVTGAGVMESRRLPGSGAGPSPDRLVLGSEGTLGVIVRAWMRLQARPSFRASQSFAFGDLYAAAEAQRLLAQSGLFPSNCRLLDPREALINGVGDGATSYLLVAFESADHPVDAWLARASEICRGAGGDPDARTHAAIPTAAALDADDDDAAARWKKMFLRGPYIRDALVRIGAITETFETAITWDRFADFHRAVLAAAEDAVRRVAGSGLVSSRVTHVYPDGAAPYFTVVAPARAGSQVAQWDDIKAAVSEVILAEGGTITHHHAVGRDHRRWYDQQRPEPFAQALRAAKRALDPAGILNPGVLIGP